MEGNHQELLLSLLGLRSTIPALLILMVLYFIMMSLFPVSLILMLLCFFSLCALITCFAVYRPLNDYVFLTKDDLGDARPQEQPADESKEPDELDEPDEAEEQLPAEAAEEE